MLWSDGIAPAQPESPRLIVTALRRHPGTELVGLMGRELSLGLQTAEQYVDSRGHASLAMGSGVVMQAAVV